MYYKSSVESVPKEISLREFRKSDLERIQFIFSDKTLLKNLNIGETETTRESREAWLIRKIKAYKQNNPREFNLGITLNGELIGSVGMHDVDYKNGRVKIGYWIERNYWGRGLTALALNQFLELIINRWNLREIEGFVNTNNLPSQRVLEKIGFEYTGIRKVINGSKSVEEKRYRLLT